MERSGTSAEGLEYRLPDLPYLRLRVEMASVREAWLPEFKGSMLRGAFGHALKATACTYGPGSPCEECVLRRGCMYTSVFETFVEDRPTPFSRGNRESPRPYLFESDTRPGSGQRHFREGDELGFDLLLFGKAAQLQPVVILALERMARGGLGPWRKPFELSRVRFLEGDGRWSLGYDRGLQAWGTPIPSLTPVSTLAAPGKAPVAVPERLQLRFVNPTRILHHKRLQSRIHDFRSLVFRMLRRTLDLAHFYAPGAQVDWAFGRFLDRANAITIESQQLTVRDMRRYSNRQRRTMALPGVVGTLTLAGDLAPFLPLLRSAEITHVGKGTTFGMGKVEVVGV